MRRTRAAKNKSQTPEEVVEAGTKTVWQWMGDDGQWEAYSPADSASLDSAVSSGRASVTLTLGTGATYRVDLKKMLQINPVSKYKRTIRCHTVKSENDDEATSSTSAASTSAVVKKEEEEEEETEGEEPATKKRKQKNPSPTENDDVRTVVMKGKAPVDPECKVKLGKAYVYSEGDDVYDVMLNQTNLQYNNNKFYLIQLLKDNESKVYSVWMRWGRVGKVGQNSLKACGGDLLKAKSIFKEKFYAKTSNDWENREYFEKEEGKYDMLFMDYCKTEQKKATVAQTTQKSQLHEKVQSLLRLICDLEAMEECVLEMKFDTQKAPLGKLTREQIRAGYAALQRIEACLKSKRNQRELLAACNQFYTRIPHNFGLKTPPIIGTEEELKQKIALLEALSDIQIAVKMLQSPQQSDEDPLDRQYRFLRCKLEPLDPDADEYKCIEKYLQSTHASTHQDYSMDVLSVFSLDREGERDNFTSSLHNKRLLWHGSRMSNWVGILNQGLRVAPPEAPVTGYMFGKGIYFADMSSKSANYCFARQHNNLGLLLLCEVALGDCQELLDADCEAGNLPAGKHSVKGLGQTGPDPSNSLTLDGVTMPMGPGVRTSAGLKSSGYSLLYNEFIVYDPAQVRMRYLLQIKFNFSPLW